MNTLEEVAEIPPSVDKNEAIYEWIKQHLEVSG